MADSSSELEIVISAIDDASAAFEEVSGSMEQMSEAAAATATQTDDSLESVGLTMNEVTVEIEDAMRTQEQSIALLAEVMQTDSEEIQQLILDEGISFQEASAVIEEANAEIAESSQETASVSKSSFTSIGVAAGIAFYAIESAVSAAVSSAEQWNEESNIIAETLKNTGSSIPLSQVQAYAQQVQAVTLLTQQQALQSEGLILSNKSLQGSYQALTMLSADLATKMSQTSGTMADNLPNATKLLANALADPVAGLNQLIRQGTIEFPAATVTMIENMAKVGDTAGADALILKTMNDQVGGLAESAANAQGGALTQLENQLTALGTVIGNDLLPLLTAIAKDLQPVIEAIAKWVQEHPKLTDAIIAGTVAFTALLAVLSVVGIIIAALASPFAATALLIAGIGAAAAALAVFLATNWSTIQSDTQTVWTDIVGFLSATWNTITGALTVAWDAIRDFFKAIWSAIAEAAALEIDLVVGAIVEALDAFDPQWRSHWQAISDFFTELWAVLKSFIESFWTWITGQFNTNLQGINTVWNAVWGGISSFFIGIWNGVESTLTGALSIIRNAISEFVSWAEGVFQPVLGAIQGIGGAVSGFLKTTINIGASVTGINDAIITPGGDIIQSDPADYLIATKTPGSLVGAGGGAGPQINIYIQGGNYLDSNGATMIGNALAKQIIQQIRVKNYAL